jgi:hypothetical protein
VINGYWDYRYRCADRHWESERQFEDAEMMMQAKGGSYLALSCPHIDLT